MKQTIDPKAAAEALVTVQEQRQRVARAVRMPWWVYAAMFVLTAGVTAANDFVTLTGAKVMAGVVLAALVLVAAVTFLGRIDMLGRARGVERRQRFSPPVFLAAALLVGGGAWFASSSGAGFVDGLAEGVGMGGYPGTVSGIVFGALFTGLFALVQFLLAADLRRVER
jgi:hypothetical protein